MNQRLADIAERSRATLTRIDRLLRTNEPNPEQEPRPISQLEIDRSAELDAMAESDR